MDSLALFFTLTESAILQISKIYSFSLSNLRVQVRSVQQQESCYDCGPFSIATAIEVCFGNNPELATFDQRKMRAHLIECFEERKLSLFPKIVKEYIPCPSRRLHVIKLFCLCYMPEEYDVMMILCDKCHKWFHCSCVCINPTEVPDVWYCKTCY